MVRCQPGCRTDANDPAECRRDTDGAAKVGALRERQHAGRQGRDAEVSQRRDRRAHDQEPPLAPALGEDSGWDLREGHAGGVDRLDDADPGECQPELARPQGEQHVENVGEPVVEDVGERGRDKHGPRGGDHRKGSAATETPMAASRNPARLIGSDRTPGYLEGSRFDRALFKPALNWTPARMSVFGG